MARQLSKNTLINISQSGGKASKGTLKYRATLPNEWMKAMNITKEDPLVEALFDGEQIIIQRPSNKHHEGFEKNDPVKVQISKSGGGASKNTLRYNFIFLNRWMQELGVTQEDRTFERTFEDGKIIFRKVKS